MRQSDIFLDDVFKVPLTRTYVSQNGIDFARNHSFGHNTSHPYDVEPLGSRRPYTYIDLTFEDGQPLYFGRISPGTSYEDAVYMHTDTSTRFYKATFAWNGDGWTLHLTDGTSMFFPEAYESTTVTQGAINRLLDGEGNELKLDRDGESRLTTIKTPHDRRICFSYDEQDRVRQIDSDQGVQVKYTYNISGMLTDVVSTSGSQRHYDYDETRMMTIRDERGRVLVRNSYESGRLVRQDYGTGEVFKYAYQYPKNASQATSVVITLPDATTRSISIPVPLHHE